MLLWCAVECARRYRRDCALVSIPAPCAAGSRVAFNLLTQHGTSFTERDIAGLRAALFFGFTFCPDVCPSTLMELTADLEALGTDGNRIKVVSVSIDPDRDTQAHLKELHVVVADQRIVRLRAHHIAAIARTYGVRCQPEPAIRSTIVRRMLLAENLPGLGSVCQSRCRGTAAPSTFQTRRVAALARGSNRRVLAVVRKFHPGERALRENQGIIRCDV